MSEISITAPENIETKIKMLAAGLHMGRSAVIRSIIEVGVQQKLIEYSEKGIPQHISQKSIMKDFEAAIQ